MTIRDAVHAIEPMDRVCAARAQARLDRLTKPLGSLGRLENLAACYVGMTREERPIIPRSVIVTFAADHGVTEEGVSAYPTAVTAQMVMNFLAGGAGVNVLARHVGAEVRIVDIGVAYDFGAIAGLIAKKVSPGTKNFRREPAMSREEAIRALEVGIALAHDAANEGIGLVGTGDMGIGNTTASAAIAAVMTGMPVSHVTGRGTGIDERTYLRKVSVIEHALARHRPKADDGIDVLAKVGGFEIAGLAGLILGAAARRLPIILDGFIAGAAALIAVSLQPLAGEYLIASHLSVECGHQTVLQHLKLTPLLDLNLRLGEGTGACLGIGLVQAALKILTQMATFEEASVSHRA